MVCNCCRSTNFELLWKNLEKQSARHAWQPLNVCICRDCGLVCLDTTEVSLQQLAEYYSTSNTFEVPGPLPEGHKAMRVDQVTWCLQNLPKGSSVKSALDVGCGAGYVLKLLKDRGVDVMGVDFSPAMIKNLKDLYGIEGRQGEFKQELVGKQFDLLTSTCVLEHMLDPAATLREMARTVRNDGYLFLEVPDAEFPRWDTIVDHLAFDHIWHWTERTLGNMLEQAGFEVVAVKHLENPPESGNPEAVLRMLSVRKPGAFSRKYAGNDYQRQKTTLAAYKKKHADYIQAFQKKIDEIHGKVGGAPVAIFCGGEHTATLMKRCDLSKLNVVAVFDNDPAVTGKTLNGYRIRHGSEAGTPEIRHYVLSTTNHERSISAQLKKRDPDAKTYGLYTSLD